MTSRQPLEDPDACLSCGGPCDHPTIEARPAWDLLALVVMALFWLVLGIALGSYLGGW